ncbi:MAG: O-antigen ligase family protein [Bacteroidetes bacterium]|nr:O-antigen ligase family protein [Bacteroidota bacterium]
MIKLKNTYVFYFVIISYILINAYVLLFAKDMFYLFNLLPFAILIVLLAIFDIEKIMYVMVFSTPLAISLKELGYDQGLNLSLPAEPLMIGITLIYFLNELSSGITDKRILKHPITIIIFIQMAWILVTTITSELPVISIKFLLARTWFLTSCYFICTQLFKRKRAIINHLLFYSVALAIVAIVTTYKHAAYAFDEKIADWIVSPFYNDHTAYGAALAMYIPVMFGLMFMKNISKTMKVVCLVLVTIFLISIIVSFARAGWLSLTVSLAVLVTLLLKIKFRTILITIVVSVVLFMSFQTEILMILGRNNTDSDGDFAANIESMSNISTDASNLERLNRWSCALQMFQEKPVLGFGPGTYQFLYAPYQKSSLKTVISTNFGDKGNAHSEYLGPLCEQGLIGAIIVIILVFAVMFLGYRLVYTVKDKSVKILTITILMGMSTYFVHGFLNNFLDTDKASVPFWGFLAMLVCIDLYFKDEEPSNDKLI